MTAGIRADIPTFPDKPTYNPSVDAAIGLRTDEVPTGVLWSPRVGFNWALSEDLREQLRGGFGLFAGRTPYVWLSNQYGNTGVEFRRLSTGFDTANRFTFVPDANAQPTTSAAWRAPKSTSSIRTTSIPSLMRGNLAYDRQLPFLGLVGTAEFLYSRTSTTSSTRT